jgi:hypothetical protein
MVDKRYQVFVSSTYEDLQEERQEVMQALLELDCIPSGMELFPAANDDQWTLIKKVIDDCDYYLVIVAGRYGSVGKDGTSYTEMEYRYALGQNKPIIAFLHKNPGDIPSNRCDSSPEARRKLEEFRTLARQKMVKTWITPAELGSVVSRSLVSLIRNNPAIGWVKGDLIPETSATEEILRLRLRVTELEKSLEVSDKSAPDGADSLAQGDDPVQLDYHIGTKWDRKKPVDIIVLTWNDIFSVIAPSLIDDASEATLQTQLSNHIAISKNSFNQDFASSQMECLLSDRSFGTIIVQLRALGLIAKSSRKRAINDRQAHWALTPHGDYAMTKLRAIQRVALESVGPTKI